MLTTWRAEGEEPRDRMQGQDETTTISIQLPGGDQEVQYRNPETVRKKMT